MPCSGSHDWRMVALSKPSCNARHDYNAHVCHDCSLTTCCKSPCYTLAWAKFHDMKINSKCMQIVVMAGGTNDFHSTPPPLEEWTSAIIDFMNTVS